MLENGGASSHGRDILRRVSDPSFGVFVLLAVLAIGVIPGLLFAKFMFINQRWGMVEGPPTERAASYRGEALVRTEIPREAPAGTVLGCTLASVWASFTLFILVPLGTLLGIYLTAMTGGGWDLASLGLVGAAISGLLLSIGVLWVCARLARRQPASIERAYSMVRLGYLHHGVVWVAAMAWFFVWDWQNWFLETLLIGIPCGLGALAALALRHAADEAMAHGRTHPVNSSPDLSPETP